MSLGVGLGLSKPHTFPCLHSMIHASCSKYEPSRALGILLKPGRRDYMNPRSVKVMMVEQTKTAYLSS